jgi:hypothetical protein
MKAGMRTKTEIVAPVAVKCRCGKQIILEPRWIGKPTACASCQADFIVTMVPDPRRHRRIPHVQYTPTVLPEKIKKDRGTAKWANVNCDCGAKIGLDPRFIGRTLTCSRCNRAFVVRMAPRGGGKAGDTAILELTAQPGRVVSPHDPPQSSLAEITPSRKNLPPTPTEMHLLCVCGEELTVPAMFFNRNMYCAGCGVLMHLKLGFDEKTHKYELQGRLLAPAKGGGA